MTNKNQSHLFDGLDNKNDWEKEWKDRPEYNNIQQPDPLITATFKFASEEDFLKFKSLIQKHLYNGKRVFDGMQRKEKKNAWFPHKEKASGYSYE